MGLSLCSELKTLGRLLAILTLASIACALPLRAQSCITLKPANSATRITVSQDEHTVVIRVAGAVNVSGDISSYTVSSNAAGLIWKAALAPDSTVTTSRAGGVVKVCQSGGIAKAAPAAQQAAPTTATTEAPKPAQQPSAAPSPEQKPAQPQPPAGEATGAAKKPPANHGDEGQAGEETTPDVTCAPPPPEFTKGAAATDKQKTLSDPEKVVTEGVKKAFETREVGPPGKRVALSDTDRRAMAQDAFSQDLAPYILCLAKPTIPRQLLSNAEEKRIDEQVSTTQPSTGTSVASAGSVPWLLGFAAESGALTQSNTNNVLTFSGTPANIVKALKAKDYLASYSLGEHTPLVKWLFTPLSFSVSVNASQSSGGNAATGSGGSMGAEPASTTTAATSGTLAGFTLRYNIWNHRDAREPRYGAQWNKFVDAHAPAMVAAVNKLVSYLINDPKYADAFVQWKLATTEAISNVDMKPEEVQRAFLQRVAALRKVIGDDAAVHKLLDEAAVSISNYSKARNDILTNISNTTAVAFEYTETQQKNLLGGPVTVTNSNPGGTNAVPNLSTFNFVVGKGSVGGSQFTANASTTIFNSIPAGTSIGRVRDYRAAVETDIPLPEIKNAGMPILSFSGLFVSLLNQPLGEKVVINDVPVSFRGNIWLFQSKLSLKIKDSGVKVPVAFTYANRTELNKEADKRGSIGVTYNLDNLFASSK